MNTLDTHTTVGELVADRPSRSRVFEKLGIDYCCGGRKSLQEACAAKGIDAATVLNVLLAAEMTASPTHETSWATAPLTDLCDHIEQTHHAYLRTELPRLATMVRKVAAVHGADRDARLLELDGVFAGFVAELGSHMMKEEQVLFPMVRELDASDKPLQFHCGTLRNPIAVMEHEHDDAGAALARMRTLTDDYVPPAEACNTWRAMLDGLRELEADMHRHVHKENSILFPRAAAMEDARHAVPA